MSSGKHNDFFLWYKRYLSNFIDQQKKGQSSDCFTAYVQMNYSANKERGKDTILNPTLLFFYHCLKPQNVCSRWW